VKSTKAFCGKAFEHEGMFAGGEFDSRRARDHRAVKIDGGGGDVRVHRVGTKRRGGENQKQGAGQEATQGFHRERMRSY
jgi:hypothetical protein